MTVNPLDNTLKPPASAPDPVPALWTHGVLGPVAAVAATAIATWRWVSSTTVTLFTVIPAPIETNAPVRKFVPWRISVVEVPPAVVFGETLVTVGFRIETKYTSGLVSGSVGPSGSSVAAARYRPSPLIRADIETIGAPPAVFDTGVRV